MNRLDSVDSAQRRTDIPAFSPGDTVRVHVRIKESETKERLQAFEGVCIARKGLVGEGSVDAAAASPSAAALLAAGALAEELAGAEQVVVVCGRYEGVDERVSEMLATDEVSIGDYVLSGGEPAAVVLVDAVTRLVPGALGSETSAVNESFSEGILDFPNYTRPVEFRGRRVPEVLLGGHHAEVARWRRLAALRKTRRNRPDLFEGVELSEQERAALDADDD